MRQIELNFFLFLFLPVVMLAQPDSLVSEEAFIENLIVDYTTAIGGEKSVKKLKTVVMKLQMKKDGVFYNITRFYNLPDQMTKLLTSEGQRLEKVVCTGKRGEHWGVRGNKVYRDADLELLMHESTFLLPLHFKKYGFQLMYDTTLLVKGVESHKIRAITQLGAEYHFYFSRLDGFLVRWSVVMEGGRLFHFDYYDFREVDNLYLPYQIEHTNDKISVQYTVNLIETNGKLDKDIFDLRE